MQTISIHSSLDATLQQLQPLLDNQSPLTYQCPWVILGTDGREAYNPFTQHTYQGFNQIRLTYNRYLVEFPQNAWATFQQIKQAGGSVKKGSKSQKITFYTIRFKDQKGKRYTAQQVEQMSVQQYNALGIYSYKCLKTFNVFNLSQTTGLAENYYTFIEPVLQTIDTISDIEQFVQNLNLNIQHKQTSNAVYNNNTDTITLPNKEQFRTTLGYYDTLLHEIGHALGSKSRLNRNQSGTFGDETYAQEELAAELFAATMLNYYGCNESINNSAAYMRAWLSALCIEDRKLDTAIEAVQAMMQYCGLE